MGLGRIDSVISFSRWRTDRAPLIGTILLVLVLWELLALFFSPTTLPGAVDLAGTLWTVLAGEDRFAPGPNYGATLARVAGGFLIALTLAILWGVAMGLRPSVGQYLAGPLFVFLTVPSVVWAFIGVIWFGLSEFLVPVFVIVAIVFPYLTVSLWKGFEAVDDRLIAMADSVGASPSLRWRDLYLPHLRPYTFGAARIGMAVSWKVALVAEVFGTATGVGVVAKFHFEAFDTGMVIAWAIPVMVLIYLGDLLVRRIERRTLVWRPSERPAMEVIG